MYLTYFNRFKDMNSYLFINEKEWEYIKETFDKNDVKESLAVIAMDYPLPYPYITKRDAWRDFQKLKGMKWNEILVEGEWYAREGTKYKYPLTYRDRKLYLRRLNTGNNSSNFFHL